MTQDSGHCGQEHLSKYALGQQKTIKPQAEYRPEHVATEHKHGQAGTLQVRPALSSSV